MHYNWKHPDWPKFEFSTSEMDDLLYHFYEKIGRISGLFEGLREKMQLDTMIKLLVAEAVKTSEIEGEYLDQKDVQSSIRNNLGLFEGNEKVRDKRAEGVSELMIDARRSFAEPLTQEKLLSWHTMLMKGDTAITAGEWRTHEEPMQAVSGPMGREKVHFEAPPSNRVPHEMDRFIRWFNDTGKGGTREIKKPVIRAAIAHLFFETIHPFEDGNGRIGRAISEKALSQDTNRPVLLSLSQAIESRKNDYYESLKHAQRSMEITPWLRYFVKTTLEAQDMAEQHIMFTMKKDKFFNRYSDCLNSRQLKVIRRMFKEGPSGFEGGLNARKYQAISKTSKATATRDLQDLVDNHILLRRGGGRSTSYDLNL